MSIYLYYYVIVETLTVNSAKTRSKPFKNDIKKHVSSDYILYYITQLLLYQDSGDGYAFEQGDYSLSLLAWDDCKQKLKLKAMKKSRIYNRKIKVNVVKYIPAKP